MPSVPVYSNLAGSTLAFPCTNVATTATLASGTGALFPNPTAGQFFSLTLINAANDTIREIVFVTARSSDVITMVRGREGTTALAWNAGDKAEHFLSALPTQIMAQPQFYNATLQTQIGGYSTGAIVASVTTPGTFWLSTTQANMTNPDAAGAGWVHPLLDQVNTWTQTNTYAAGPVLNNGVALYGKDTGGTPRPVLQLDTANNVNSWVGNSGVWRILNFASSVQLLSVDNSGNLTTNAAIASNGNITANNGRLRATFGAYLSGDPAAGTILNDFFTENNGSNYAYCRLPNGFTIQGYEGGNGTFPYTRINFVRAFTNRCIQVVSLESNPVGWGGTGGFPTIHGIDGIDQFGFNIWITRFQGGSSGFQHVAPGWGFRYIAIGI